MESMRWDVVVKLGLDDVCPPDIMFATVWFRMKSPTVKTHESPPAMHSMTQLKNPASMIVLGCVASDGWVVLSHLILAGLDINTVEDLMIQKRSWCRGFLAITMQTKWCSSRSSRVQNSARLLAREDADVRAEEHLTLLLFEHVSLWRLTVGRLQREDQCCHPRHHRSSEDEHQETIEVEHAGGGQGDMCSVQRPIRPDEGGLLGLYRVKWDLRYTWMHVQKISPISVKLAVIWHEKERHWKVLIYLPTPVYIPIGPVTPENFKILTKMTTCSRNTK